MKQVSFRTATSADTPLVARFLRELAVYERMAGEAKIDEKRLAEHMAPGATPQFWVVIAEMDGKPVGMATYFMRYSTFETAWGIHLEDLYIVEECRRGGLGRAFFVVLARIAKQHGYKRIDFSVLNWNHQARSLYEKIGARVMDDWSAMRFEGENLELLATRPDLVAIQMLQEH